MLQLIKGSKADYDALGERHPDSEYYAQALFLDSDTKRLYFAGDLLGTKVTSTVSVDGRGFPKKTYRFENNEGGETVEISDAVIPALSEDGKLTLRAGGADADASDGLMSVRDKYLLEALARMFGVTLNYERYATVTDYPEDVDNGREGVSRDVDVRYDEERGQWGYDYPAYDFEDVSKSGIASQHHIPAGFKEVPAESVRMKSVSASRQKDVTYFSGGDLSDDLATSDGLGGIPKGTTVSDLEGKSISEVLSQLLFGAKAPTVDSAKFDASKAPSADASTPDGFGGVPAGTTASELSQKTISEILSDLLFKDGAPRKTDVQLYDGKTLSDAKAMLLRHGGLPAGTTVADLEKLTLSEVFSKILFETAQPKKVSGTSVHLDFSDSYAPDGYVDVGCEYPDSASDFRLTFKPETWQNYSSDGSPVGEPQELTEVVSVKYKLYDYEHPLSGGHRRTKVEGMDVDKEGPNGTIHLWDIYDLADDAEDYADHFENYRVKDGDRCVYQAVVAYRYKALPKDSDGNPVAIKDADGADVTVGDDSKIYEMRTNYLRYTGVDGAESEEDAASNAVAGWRIYSNASKVSKNSLWSSRNEEPGAYLGDGAKEPTGFFATGDDVLYLQWPSRTAPEQRFLVYVPKGYSVVSAEGAHDTLTEDWSAASGFEKAGTAKIANTKGVVGDYDAYEIKKAAVITTVRIEVRRDS